MVRQLDLEKRETYLNVALKLFAAEGVQQTSTAAITKEAGTAAGTLFLYFPTKQDLIHELVLRIGKKQSEHIKALLQPSLSVQETFWAIWEGSIRWFLQNREAYRYIQQVRDTQLIDEDVIRESEKYLGYYFDVIQRGLAEEKIKAYPAEMVGNLLYHNIAAVVSLIDAQPEPARQEEYIRWGFEIFWNGIKR